MANLAGRDVVPGVGSAASEDETATRLGVVDWSRGRRVHPAATRNRPSLSVDKRVKNATKRCADDRDRF